ncbi:MAG TPA: 2OG-Fe(II) oxygenase [Polyangiaceae bacterium]|nr:2OG-Fe(II) oxygenase [Polyangiaceae bacterium]
MPLICVSRTATELASDAELEAARIELAERHHLHLRGFLSQELRDFIADGVERATFTPFTHATGALDYSMAEGPEMDALAFALADPVLIRVVERLSGRRPLTSFHGRAYRMLEGPHFDEWHDDLDGNRQVAITVNLGRAPYEGGHLLMRTHPEKEPVFDIHNKEPGDAILFMIGEHLEHTITSVVGSVPKTAFAGWYCSQPDRLSKKIFRLG